MKSKTLITVLMVAVVLFIYGYEPIQGQAEESIIPEKIGVVDITKVFSECKRNEEYAQQLENERQEIISKLDALQKEIEAVRSGLQTLKQGSADRLERVRQFMEKEAKLEAQKEFYNQKMEVENRRWTEQLYEDILDIIKEVAKQKNLELVLENSSVALPATSFNELMLSVKTNKVLYSDGCVDITQEVVEKLDAEQSE